MLLCASSNAAKNKNQKRESSSADDRGETPRSLRLHDPLFRIPEPWAELRRIPSGESISELKCCNDGEKDSGAPGGAGCKAAKLRRLALD